MDRHEPYFKQLFEQYKIPLHDYAQTFAGSHEAAQDIVQEIFIRLWRHRERLHEVQNMDSYIFRIARNESIRYFNRLALDGKLFKEFKERIVKLADSPAERLDVRETQRLLDKAILKLSPKRQQVYRLSRQQGLSLEEISAELHLSYNTVKNHLIAALKQIRSFMSSHYFALLLALLLSLL